MGALDYEEEIPEDVEYYIEIEWEEDPEGVIDWFANLFVYGKQENITYDLSRKDERRVLRSILEQMEEHNEL
jgi:hypothetical protein